MRDNNYDAVILGDGDFPSSPEAMAVLNSARILCCCDKAGMEYIRRTGKTPDAIVGDGDSLPQEFKERYASIWHQVDEQEYNDLTKATRYVLGLLADRAEGASIAYLGATGKREDHTLGNISLMAFYRQEFGIEPVMITDYGTFRTGSGRTEFRSVAGQQVSIFNLNCTSLCSTGLRWNSYAYKQLWQGTLNESLANSFVIDGDGDYLVYQT